MVATKEPYERLGPEQNAQLIHLLQDGTDNIRLAKVQQWHVAYYSLLVDTAIVLAAKLITDSDSIFPFTRGTLATSEAGNACLSDSISPFARGTLAMIGSVLLAFTGIAGTLMIWHLQCWMAKQRGRLIEIEDHLSPVYRKIVRARPRQNYGMPSYAQLIAWVLTAFLVVGGLVGATLLLFLLRVPELLTLILVAGFAVGVAVFICIGFLSLPAKWCAK